MLTCIKYARFRFVYMESPVTVLLISKNEQKTIGVNMKTTTPSMRRTGASLLLAAATSLAVSMAAADGIDDLLQNCANCHGQDGVSREPTIPTIAGLSEFYLNDNMLVYQEQGRPCVESEYLDGPDKGSKTDMCRIAQNLSEMQIEALAKHYAGKPFVRAKQAFDPDKAARGRKIHDANCEKCHAEGGSSAEDDAGVLAGQWTPYLRQTFEFYASGERAMPKKMKPKMKKLDADSTEALLHYYANQQ